jgi:ribose transport system permease protein
MSNVAREAGTKSSTAATKEGGVGRGSRRLADRLKDSSTLIIFAAMFAVCALSSDVFFTFRNITNLLRQVSEIGIISLGMLLVIVTGGIDLSVGSIVALASVVVAKLTLNMGLVPGIALTIALGAVCGSLSGYFTSRRKMAPFVVTLAIMTIARGSAYIISKGAPTMLGEKAMALEAFGSGYLFGGVPFPVLLMVAIFLLVLVILRNTVFGRLILAIGSNEKAVRLSGVQVWIHKFGVYAISGVFSAIAGIISTSRTGVGSPLVGQGYELDAIAAVVIGGASLSGGRGTALNTFLGVLILGMIGNVMNLMNISGYPQQVIKGVIIVIAVLLQGIDNRQDA